MTRFEIFPQVRRSTFKPLHLAVLLAASFTLGAVPAVAQFIGPTPLTLVNGWTDAPFTTSHAMVEVQNNFVQLRGAIASGTTAVATTLPAGFRPLTDVFVPVDLCNAAKGRIHVTPAGVLDVETEGPFSDAQCFTSLDGASFAINGTSFTPITLINGWTSSPFSTRAPGVRIIGSAVHFKGAMATAGTNMSPFVLPPGFWPTTDVYIPVDLCNATNGRLHIAPSGAVDVEPEGGTISNAQCFTSLEGAWYGLVSSSYQLLGPLVNGWTNSPFSTSPLGAVDHWGVIYFKGAVSGGTASQILTLPPRFAPVTNVFINIDLCNGTKGRIDIQPTGVVSVEAQGGTFSNAQCFTSLDGASYVQ